MKGDGVVKRVLRTGKSFILRNGIFVPVEDRTPAGLIVPPPPKLEVADVIPESWRREALARGLRTGMLPAEALTTRR